MTGAEREERILGLEPLVRAIANARHAAMPSFVTRDDIVSVAWLGAISAVDHFDPARRLELATYARWKIHGAIGDYIRGLDPLSRDERRRFSANPDLQAPRTFSMNTMHDDTHRSFDIGDKRSRDAFRRIEARVDLAKMIRASRNVKPRSLRVVWRHACGETLKVIGRSEGVNEARASQIRKATLTQLRAAA